MDSIFFVQQIINGISVGCIYALVALGITLIWEAMTVMNFAQGEILMLGAYIGVILLQNKIPVFLAFIITLVILFVFGIAMEKILFRPVVKSKERVLMIVIITVSLSAIIRTLIIIKFGALGIVAPPILGDESIRIGSFFILPGRIPIAIMTAAGMVMLNIFLRSTKIGIAMRAVAQNRLASYLMGINVNLANALTVGMACVVGGFGGLLMAPVFYVEPTMGIIIGIKGFAAAIIGGLGNIKGAIVGGILLGVIETFSIAFISSGYKDAISFFVLIIFILFLPGGIFGAHQELGGE